MFTFEPVAGHETDFINELIAHEMLRDPDPWELDYFRNESRIAAEEGTPINECAAWAENYAYNVLGVQVAPVIEAVYEGYMGGLPPAPSIIDVMVFDDEYPTDDALRFTPLDEIFRFQ